MILPAVIGGPQGGLYPPTSLAARVAGVKHATVIIANTLLPELADEQLVPARAREA
jgi:hypothetical protein